MLLSKYPAKPVKIFKVARIFLLWAVLLLPRLLYAQTDQQFWFVAPYINDEGRNFDKPTVFRITASSTPATVTISMPANPSFIPITTNIGANSTSSIDVTPWLTQIQNTPENTVLNRGILIKSTASITAYYEVVSSFCDCDPEVFSLKGKNALGTEFFISSQYSFDESFSYSGTNSFDIVATQNNTHVKITPKQNIIGHNANIPFTITLNAGQTYSAVAINKTAGGHLQGSYITSDQAIAVTLKDDLVQVSSCADLIGDQTVPTSVLGTEYIVTRGFLQPNDYVYVLAVEDGTSVYVDGSTAPVAVLAKGASYTINLVNSSTYIRGSKKLYAYHLTGNGCEVGSAIIPRLECSGSQSVNIVRSNGDLFAVMITTKNGNQNNFTVNGSKTLVQALNFSAVPGTSGAYVSARVDLTNYIAAGTTINVSNSTGLFSLGFINGGVNDGTVYGYFSDFKSSYVQNSEVEDCQGEPVQLTAFGGGTYHWSPAKGLSNPNIANPKASPAVTTSYKVIITTPDGCVDSATVNVKVLNVKKVDTTVAICAGGSYKLPSGKSVSGNGTFHDTVRYAIGCDSLVTTLHLKTTGAAPSITISTPATSICAGTPAIFTAVASNEGVSPVYQWQVDGKNVGTNSKTFTGNNLINGNKITCLLTSNAPCITQPNATSNIIGMTVNPVVTPSVSIAASGNNICSGTPITFTAVPANGGSTPVYQWLVNGNNAGTNSATFTSSTLINGDKISCVLTSNAVCATPVSATSNILTENVTPSVTPAVSIGASASNICPGTLVTFTATPTSGGSAPVYHWMVNGNSAGTNSPVFASSTFANNDVISCRLTSNAACLITPDATSNNVTITVSQPVAPSVNINISENNICAGTPVTFTATPTNGGSTPIYQWLVNGNKAGTNSSIFTSSTFANGDVVSCVMTSGAACAIPAGATSNSITVSVNPVSATSVSIAASENNICAGTLVTFTATPTNGGSAPVYQWLVNGNITGTTGATLSGSNFANGDVITCVMTSNVLCAAPANVTSNSITMTINPLVTPTVSIATPASSICPGATVTFTATPVGGGSAPVYHWMVNGNSVGTNSPIFASSTLSTGDVISCQLTSNAACLVTPDATSNNITITVNPQVAPAVSINISENNICAGTLVTLTATPANGGNTPVYQWLVNGNNAGTNSATFSSSAFANGDVITCKMTSGAACAVPASVISNAITMNVNPVFIPAISIAASVNNICAGTPVTFTATPTNSGSAPVYQWLVNGINAGTNNTTLSGSNFANGDKISCVMTSNALCAVPVTATSNIITLNVNPLVTPTVSIVASANNICPGTLVTFTATPTNGGNAPLYHWAINGNSAGANSPVFASSTLLNGDIVSCQLSSNAACLVTPDATSNNVTITVDPQVIPAVIISLSENNICAGTPVTFTATPTNGGSAAVYQWLVNGNSAGTNSAIFSGSMFANGDVVSCVLTSSANCATPASITSNSITMSIFPLPVVNAGANKTIKQGNSTTLAATASGNITDITWTPATDLDNSKILDPTATPASTTTYSITVQSADGCTSTSEVTVTVLKEITIPNTFTPNGDGINDRWDIKNLKDYQSCTVKIFDRWGTEVFSSRGYYDPWDGTYHGKRVSFGTYYYVINLNNDTQPLAGFVLIIR